jgi:hypothetical protein
MQVSGGNVAHLAVKPAALTANLTAQRDLVRLQASEVGHLNDSESLPRGPQ